MSTTDRWDELFGNGRRWRIAEELTGTVQAFPVTGDGPPVDVTFAKGEFELPEGAAYRSLLSTNLGRRGIVLQETDPSGAQDLPGSRIAVGYIALGKARSKYAAVW